MTDQNFNPFEQEEPRGKQEPAPEENLPSDPAPEIVTPEEIASLPLTTAANLLGEVEEETPPPPEHSEPPPPGEPHGPFLVQDARGQGSGKRVLIEAEDGAYEPLGIWLATFHPGLTSEEVYHLLTRMGLPGVLASEHAKRREIGRGEGHRLEAALPDDIEEVWGGGKLDGTGLPAANTARKLISEWGEQGFRDSALHQAALAEIKHVEVKDAFSKAFVEAQRKKEKR